MGWPVEKFLPGNHEWLHGLACGKISPGQSGAAPWAGPWNNFPRAIRSNSMGWPVGPYLPGNQEELHGLTRRTVSSGQSGGAPWADPWTRLNRKLR